MVRAGMGGDRGRVMQSKKVQVSYTKEYKICRQCMGIAEKESDRWWECNDDECGCVKFVMGAQEGENTFLPSIDLVSYYRKDSL